MQGGGGGDVERHECRDLPRLFRQEGADLLLAVHDDPRRHALHAAGTQPSGDLLPEDWRDLIADDPVHDPPCLLRLDPRHVDGPGGLEGPLHLGLRDRVERHALGPAGIDAEHLRQVPGDGLPLAVEVGGEPDVARALGELPQFGDRLHLVAVDLVGRREVMLEIDAGHGLPRALWGTARQVADVADRGLHHEALAEVLLDGLRLGGTLDDDQFVAPARGACRGGASAAWLPDGSRDTWCALRGGSFGGLLRHGRGHPGGSARLRACRAW